VNRVFDTLKTLSVFAAPTAVFINARDLIKYTSKESDAEFIKDNVLAFEPSVDHGCFLFVWCFGVSDLCAVAKSIDSLDLEILNSIYSIGHNFMNNHVKHHS
jgi:hypothetical protein